MHIQWVDIETNQHKNSSVVAKTIKIHPNKPNPMTRTTKTIHIKNQPIQTIKAAVTEWARQNHIKPLIDNPTYLYGQQGRGILTAPKYYEITLEATPDGVIVQTEGWVTSFPPSFWPDVRIYVQEIEFTETALIYGGIPRKQGMTTIKQLWATLEAKTKTFR